MHPVSLLLGGNERKISFYTSSVVENVNRVYLGSGSIRNK